MLTFAISLLLTAGAAVAMLVIIGMLTTNRHAILSALAGQGAYPMRRGVGDDALPPRIGVRMPAASLRQGSRRMASARGPVSPLRAAA